MQEDLATKLDGLLERYLGLLDQYQQAREQLAKALSSVSAMQSANKKCLSGNMSVQILHAIASYHIFCALLLRTANQGYLSLARANAASAGRAHYGQDYYDERMQASRRMYMNGVLC